MTDPYREHIPRIEESTSSKNTYKYVLRKNYRCPVCNNVTEHKKIIQCYGFEKLLIRGHFWWRRYCPIDGIHHHVLCTNCDVSWVVMIGLHKNSSCPVCEKSVDSKIWKSQVGWVPTGADKLCHPLKRIVKGMWWWKKHCAVEGVHRHYRCNECKVSWIAMAPDQSEANPDIKDAYL